MSSAACKRCAMVSTNWRQARGLDGPSIAAPRHGFDARLDDGDRQPIGRCEAFATDRLGRPSCPRLIAGARRRSTDCDFARLPRGSARDSQPMRLAAAAPKPSPMRRRDKRFAADVASSRLRRARCSFNAASRRTASRAARLPRSRLVYRLHRRQQPGRPSRLGRRSH
jgi:hypothetical protein